MFSYIFKYKKDLFVTNLSRIKINIYIFIYTVNLEKVVHVQIYKYKDISHT